MAVLHILNQSPTSDTLASCLRCMAAEDRLLLLEDAVYSACEPHAGALRQSGHRCYLLGADAAARGIEHRLDDTVQSIDHAGFVALAIECDAVQSWY